MHRVKGGYRVRSVSIGSSPLTPRSVGIRSFPSPPCHVAHPLPGLGNSLLLRVTRTVTVLADWLKITFYSHFLLYRANYTMALSIDDEFSQKYSFSSFFRGRNWVFLRMSVSHMCSGSSRRGQILKFVYYIGIFWPYLKGYIWD